MKFEMHGDAALSQVIRGLLMDSHLTGEANILICPNIDGLTEEAMNVVVVIGAWLMTSLTTLDVLPL